MTRTMLATLFILTLIGVVFAILPEESAESADLYPSLSPELLMAPENRRTPQGPALYAYRRVASDLTRITVSASRRGQGEIDPRLFSNFLEHLGGTIYDGLWANVVANPQFEPDKQGRLERWKRDPGAQWDSAGLAGRSVKLSRESAVSQLLNLPVHRQRRFLGCLWARGLAGASARLEVTLRRQDKPAVVARATVTVSSADWKRFAFDMRIPPAALDRGEAAELRIQCADGAAALDMVELFPADHADGVDPDVLRLSQDLKIELLRWPGGNFVSGYRWRDGIGPREGRPTRPNPAWAGLETHHFGTDEYMRFCAAIGAKPMICVNAGDGTPEEAADWVEYCNGAPNTRMGRLRARNGRRAPYNVRVWEIGNELYGDWQIGHTDPAGNAQRYLRFRKAMLARDPSIEIIATGRGDEYKGDGLAQVNRWNEILLRTAATGTALPDLISVHPLVPLPANLSNFTYEQVFESAMAHPTWWSQSFLPALRRQTQIASAKSKVSVAVTEWGLIVGGPQWLRYPNHDEQSGAIYAALFYNAMLRAADFVRIGNVTALMHGGGIKRPNQYAYVDPMYYVEKMYGVARPKRLLPVAVEGPGLDVPQRGLLPEVQDVPLLDVIAAESGRERLLFIVNRDLKNARQAEITLPQSADRIKGERLAAPSKARNTLSKPNAVRPEPFEFSPGSKTFRREFAPCSLTILRWQ